MIATLIDQFHIDDIKNPTHPSVFFRNEKYDMLILRIPQYDLSQQSIDFMSFAFIITEDKYYYYDKSSNEFIDLFDCKGFYRFLDEKIDIIVKIKYDYLQKIEKIEDVFYSGKAIKNFNQQWFLYKNEMVRSNRLLNKAQEVMQEILTVYKNDPDYLERHFEDLYEHIQRSYRNSGFILEKLDALYSFNLTQNNEQMNRIMYVLTILSGIFLPLNLIVGFFGMNTTDLPFTNEAMGTYNVILFLIGTAIFATGLSFFLQKKTKVNK